MSLKENDIYNEAVMEYLDTELVSDCCSAAVYSPTKDCAQGMDCKEYCDAVETE